MTRIMSIPILSKDEVVDTFKCNFCDKEFEIDSLWYAGQCVICKKNICRSDEHKFEFTEHGDLYCEYCKTNTQKYVKMTKLIEHHTKYEEIDGVDETVFIPMSEHVKLHNQLRKIDHERIPIKILSAAYLRTKKRKEYEINYRLTKSINKLRPTDTRPSQCPYCNSHNIYNGGKTYTGKQRRICKNCGKYHTLGINYKDKIISTCPYCDSNLAKNAGKTYTGKQRRLCKDCGRYYSLGINYINI
jgi:transposase-like protein